MWWILGSIAGATSDGARCGAPVITAVRPEDGSVVSPEARIEVDHEGGTCRSPFVGLFDVHGVPVEAEAWLFDGQEVFVPTDPLPEGVYQVYGSTWSSGEATLHSTFTVSDEVEPPPPPPPPEVALDATRTCEGFLSSRVVVTATFEEDPEGWGMLFLDVSTELGLQASFEDLWRGEPTIGHTVRVAGGREPCVTARLEDAHGVEVWRETTCAEPFGCPAEPWTEDPEGCGCASTGGAGLWLAPALLLARRRRQA